MTTRRQSAQAPIIELAGPRALLGQDHAVPADPAVAVSVAACFPSSPGLRLTLVASKETKRYKAWLWAGNDGQTYFSKLLNDRSMAWKPGGTIERILRRNPSLKRVESNQQE